MRPAGDLTGWILATAPRAVAYATAPLRDRERAEDGVQDCSCRLLARPRYPTSGPTGSSS